MSAPWLATTGRCRIWLTTTRCYRPRARGPHDGRASGPGHSPALQDAAHADDRHAVRPPGGRSGPRRSIACRLSRGAAGGRDGGAGEPRDHPAAARGEAAAVKTLEAFEFDRSGVSAALLCTLAAGDYVTRAEPVLLVGEAGTGKTHLATGLCVAACRQRRRVRFTTATALVNELAEAAHANQLRRALGRWERLDLICIDEFGYVPLAGAACELMFQVIADRAEKAAVIVTTNLPFSEWSQVIPNPRLCKALIDRLTDQAHIITRGADSYRFRRTSAQRKAAKS